MGFDYQQYLASREWAKRKQAVMGRCGGFCERCLYGEYESTHHLTYKHIGNEPLEDLLAVCNCCHAYLSAKSDVDPINEAMLWIVLGPRNNGRDWEKFSDGLRVGCIRIVGGFAPGNPEPIFVEPVDLYIRSGMMEGSGVCAGLI
jgi:hypothetical protein